MHGQHVDPKGAVVAHIAKLDLRPTQQEGNHAWYWKPRASEVIDLGGEPTSATLLILLNRRVNDLRALRGPRNTGQEG